MEQVTGREQVTEAVTKLLAHYLQFSENEIQLKFNIISDLGADSFSIIEITIAVEEKFHIQIPDEEAGTMKTVGDVIDKVCKILG